LSKLRLQLDNAYDWLWRSEQARKPFIRFLQAVSGVPLDNIRQDEEAAKKMIVWPISPSREEDQTVKEARADGFLIVEYEIVEREPRYLFSRKAA